MKKLMTLILAAMLLAACGQTTGNTQAPASSRAAASEAASEPAPDAEPQEADASSAAASGPAPAEEAPQEEAFPTLVELAGMAYPEIQEAAQWDSQKTDIISTASVTGSYFTAMAGDVKLVFDFWVNLEEQPDTCPKTLACFNDAGVPYPVTDEFTTYMEYQEIQQATGNALPAIERQAGEGGDTWGLETTVGRYTLFLDFDSGEPAAKLISARVSDLN